MPIVVSVCVFIFVGRIEHFIVLEGVEAMAERQRVDRDLRRLLEEREAEIVNMRVMYIQRSPEAVTGSNLPINTYAALGGPDTGATFTALDENSRV